MVLGAVHALDGDGISALFFEQLAKENKGLSSCRGHIPATVMFEQGFAKALYYSERVTRIGESGAKTRHMEVKKRAGKDCDTESIRQVMLKGCGDGEICAVFMSIPAREAREGGTVTYLTPRTLNEFLQSQMQKPKGLLQKFVRPRGSTNAVILCTWSPTFMVTELRRNRYSLSDKHVDPSVRTMTFEADANDCVVSAVSLSVTSLLREQCAAIVSHFSSTDHLLIVRMALCFKLDDHANVRLLFSSSIRVVEPKHAIRDVSTPVNLNVRLTSGHRRLRLDGRADADADADAAGGTSKQHLRAASDDAFLQKVMASGDRRNRALLVAAAACSQSLPLTDTAAACRSRKVPAKQRRKQGSRSLAASTIAGETGTGVNSSGMVAAAAAAAAAVRVVRAKDGHARAPSFVAGGDLPAPALSGSASLNTTSGAGGPAVSAKAAAAVAVATTTATAMAGSAESGRGGPPTHPRSSHSHTQEWARERDGRAAQQRQTPQKQYQPPPTPSPLSECSARPCVVPMPQHQQAQVPPPPLPPPPPPPEVARAAPVAPLSAAAVCTSPPTSKSYTYTHCTDGDDVTTYVHSPSAGAPFPQSPAAGGKKGCWAKGGKTASVRHRGAALPAGAAHHGAPTASLSPRGSTAGQRAEGERIRQESIKKKRLFLLQQRAAVLGDPAAPATSAAATVQPVGTGGAVDESLLLTHPSLLRSQPVPLVPLDSGSPLLEPRAAAAVRSPGCLSDDERLAVRKLVDRGPGAGSGSGFASAILATPVSYSHHPEGRGTTKYSPQYSLNIVSSHLAHAVAASAAASGVALEASGSDNAALRRSVRGPADADAAAAAAREDPTNYAFYNKTIVDCILPSMFPQPQEAPASADPSVFVVPSSARKRPSTGQPLTSSAGSVVAASEMTGGGSGGSTGARAVSVSGSLRPRQKIRSEGVLLRRPQTQPGPQGAPPLPPPPPPPPPPLPPPVAHTPSSLEVPAAASDARQPPPPATPVAAAAASFRRPTAAREAQVRDEAAAAASQAGDEEDEEDEEEDERGGGGGGALPPSSPVLSRPPPALRPAEATPAAAGAASPVAAEAEAEAEAESAFAPRSPVAVKRRRRRVLQRNALRAGGVLAGEAVVATAFLGEGGEEEARLWEGRLRGQPAGVRAAVEEATARVVEEMEEFVAELRYAMYSHYVSTGKDYYLEAPAVWRGVLDGDGLSVVLKKFGPERVRTVEFCTKELPRPSLEADPEADEGGEDGSDVDGADSVCLGGNADVFSTIAPPAHVPVGSTLYPADPGALPWPVGQHRAINLAAIKMPAPAAAEAAKESNRQREERERRRDACVRTFKAESKALLLQNRKRYLQCYNSGVTARWPVQEDVGFDWVGEHSVAHRSKHTALLLPYSASNLLYAKGDGGSSLLEPYASAPNGPLYRVIRREQIRLRLEPAGGADVVAGGEQSE